MSKISLAAAALLAAIPFAAAPWAGAHAAPMSGQEISARSAGGEFRGFGTTRKSQYESMIWRFRPDGSVTSISTFGRRAGPVSITEEYQDAGTWRVEGDRLCVQFGVVHSYLSGCYGVDGTSGDHVRLLGPVNLEGTLGR